MAPRFLAILALLLNLASAARIIRQKMREHMEELEREAILQKSPEATESQTSSSLLSVASETTVEKASQTTMKKTPPVQEYKDLFAKYGGRSDGITVEELKAALSHQYDNLGILHRLFDKDGDGKLGEQEFVPLMHALDSQWLERGQENIFEAAFEFYNSGDGLTQSEFSKIFKAINPHLGESEITAYFEEAKNEAGTVTLDNFLKAGQKLSSSSLVNLAQTITKKTPPVQEYEDLFAKYGGRSNGITVEELKAALSHQYDNLGILHRLFDKDGDGKLGEQEFTPLMRALDRHWLERGLENFFEASFELYNSGDGLTQSEFSKIFKAINPHLTDSEITAYFKEAQNEAGMVTLENFLEAGQKLTSGSLLNLAQTTTKKTEQQ